MATKRKKIVTLKQVRKMTVDEIEQDWDDSIVWGTVDKPTTAKELPVLYNNTTENDDWMKKLPGYASELAIHEQLRKDHEEKSK